MERASGDNDRRAPGTADIEAVLRAGAAPVLRYLRARLDTPAQAEDLAQVTLVRAVAALGRGDRPAQPVPWLLGIARNVLLETWRGERARRRLQERLAQMARPGAGSRPRWVVTAWAMRPN